MGDRCWIRTISRCAPALGLICIVSVSCSEVPDVLAPDTIYTNGTVLTMDGEGRVAEAVAVKGDRIVMVGSNNDIRRLAGAATRIVDIAGRTMMPGFTPLTTISRVQVWSRSAWSI